MGAFLGAIPGVGAALGTGATLGQIIGGAIAPRPAGSVGTSGYWPFQTPLAPTVPINQASGLSNEVVARIWAIDEPPGVPSELRYPDPVTGLPGWAMQRFSEIGAATGKNPLDALYGLPLNMVPYWFWNALTTAWGQSVEAQIPGLPAEEAGLPRGQVGETGRAPAEEPTPTPEYTGPEIESGVDTSGWPEWAKVLIPSMGLAAVAALLSSLGQLPTVSTTTYTTPEPESARPEVPPPLPIPETPLPDITGGGASPIVWPEVPYNPSPLPTTLTPIPVPPFDIPPGTSATTGGGAVVPWADIAGAIGRALMGNQGQGYGGVGGRGGLGGLGGVGQARSLFEMSPYIGKGLPTLAQILRGA